MKLPKHIRIGAFKIELVCLPHNLMYEVGEAQGTFIIKPPYQIFLDKEMIERGGADAINVVLHELLHVGYYQYHLKDKEEETIVNSFGNFMTELLCHTGLGDWIAFEKNRERKTSGGIPVRIRNTKKKRKTTRPS